MISKTKIRAIDAHAHSLRKDKEGYRIALAGTTHRNSLDLLDTFSDRDNVFIGYGLHPWFIKQHQNEKKEVKKYAIKVNFKFFTSLRCFNISSISLR